MCNHLTVTHIHYALNLSYDREVDQPQLEFPQELQLGTFPTCAFLRDIVLLVSLTSHSLQKSINALIVFFSRILHSSDF